MERKPDIQYIDKFYVHGSEARVLELKPQKKKAKTVLPEAAPVKEKVMRDAIPCLNPEGRLAIITFHSLEDRIVKNAMADAAKGCTCPPNFPVCVCGKKPKVKLITRKPIVSGDEELERNPRARSAKLRICEKL